MGPPTGGACGVWTTAGSITAAETEVAIDSVLSED